MANPVIFLGTGNKKVPNISSDIFLVDSQNEKMQT